MNNRDIFKYKAYWQVIEDHTGYDFSGYSFESLNCRLENFISSESIGSPIELRDKVFSSGTSSRYVLNRLLVNYTEMFRDPEFFISFRKNVLPFLSSYPEISIWHAGCSTGEEVYSLAILLDEYKLLNRCNILATDINEADLNNARRGIYSLSNMQESNERYYRAGGKKALSNYYTAFYNNIIFHKHLRDRLHFRSEDLIHENIKNKFHFILCRNVFVYFNYELQQKVLKSLSEGLCDAGYLGMGLKEHFVDIGNTDLVLVDSLNKIYKKSI